MAIAGFQNMCGFNSIHGESQTLPSGPWNSHDRPGFKASMLLKMWREMEREHVVSHSLARDRFRPHKDKSDVSNVDTASTISIDRQDSEDNLSDYSVIVQDCGVCDGQRPTLCDQDDRNSCSSDLTDDIDEVDRERVRQIFQDWHMKNGVIRGPVSKTSHVSCENEFERVRIVRKWVKMNGQHRGSVSREKQNSQNGIQIDQLQDGSVSNVCEVSGMRRIRKIYGRQTLVEVLTMAEKERKRELEELSQRQPVTCFAHRNRIQSLLRGRFLQSGRRLIQDKEPSSSAASELGLLRKKLPVSGLREGFLSRLDNLDAGSQSHAPSICSNNNNNTFGDDQVDVIDEISASSADIAITMQEEATVELHAQQIIEDSDEGSVDRTYEDTVNVTIKEVEEHGDNPMHEQGEGSSSIMVGYDSTTTPSTTNNEDVEWFHNDIQSAQVIQELPEEEQWEEDVDFDSSSERSSSAAEEEEEEDVVETETTNFPNDDDIVYNNTELQELSSRRRVSNLLNNSEFRHSLDRILVSYVERVQTGADGTSDEWESDGTSSIFMESPVEEEEEEIIDDSTWSRRLSVRQHGRIEWEINELRVEMGMLQKQLNEMQRMLETFMDMQMELQQSIRQEVVSAAATAALNYRFLSKELQLSQSQQQHHSSLHSG